MHPDEGATIRAFVAPAKRPRRLEALASQRRRSGFLDRLKHCRDFDERFVRALPSNADVVAELTARGAPENCYVLRPRIRWMLASFLSKLRLPKPSVVDGGRSSAVSLVGWRTTTMSAASVGCCWNAKQ